MIALSYFIIRCAISLQAQIQNTEVSKDLKMTTEEISKLDFFSKFSLCIEQVYLPIYFF